MPTYRNDGTTSYLVGNKAVVPNGVIAVERELDIPNFTKTADTPYVELTESVHSLTFTNADEEQSITGLLGANIVRVRNPTVAFQIRAGSSSSDKYYPVAVNGFNDIVNNNLFDTLYIKAPSAGSVTIIIIPN